MFDRLYDYRELIGYLAGTLATMAFLPQVLKTLRLRRTGDISLVMYALLCAGVGLWLLYGVLIYSWPVILSNIVTLALAGAVLALKIRHG
ncbi:MAG TPA: SemiSWEET transporter [Terriglobia bacterium]|nr:SemiSWEET transporter [Terriglobia bacterium]